MLGLLLACQHHLPALPDDFPYDAASADQAVELGQEVASISAPWFNRGRLQATEQLAVELGAQHPGP